MSEKVHKTDEQWRAELTPEQYRSKFGLPRDYPMVSPAYSKVRSAISKTVGLGHWRTGKKARRKRG